MHSDFNKPALNKDQKARMKALYKRDNYHGFLAIAQDLLWISIAVFLSEYISIWLLPVAVLIIGARQRALASLLHEAAHGTLFAKKFLNETVGRVLCGWSILQSFSAYRTSHVLNHHPKIGETADDPDLKFMLEMGVYAPQTRSRFIWNYLFAPSIGLRIPAYLWFVLKDRLLGNLLDRRFRNETLALLLVHTACIIVAAATGWAWELFIYWYLPYLTSFGIIGWLSELSEHFPLMSGKGSGEIYGSRNRYAAWPEKLLIGMHGDHLHLTHHLLPGVPHWNLAAATEILREDPEFKDWDDIWGGIFTSKDAARTSLAGYVINTHKFSDEFTPISALEAPS